MPRASAARFIVLVDALFARHIEYTVSTESSIASASCFLLLSFMARATNKAFPVFNFTPPLSIYERSILAIEITSNFVFFTKNIKYDVD